MVGVSSSGFFALERRAQNDGKNKQKKMRGFFDCVWRRIAPNSAQNDGLPIDAAIRRRWVKLWGCRVRVEV